MESQCTVSVYFSADYKPSTTNGPSFEQTRKLFSLGCFLLNLVEGRKFLKHQTILSLFNSYLLLKAELDLYLNKFESPFPKFG